MLRQAWCPVSSADFRRIGSESGGDKASGLFRAAVSAFAALVRPSRREIAQVEELALSLFDRTTPDARRYVAAVLSECESAPKALVLRLCDEPIDIAAPLLVRSPALSDADLLSLVSRHGAPHARAVARRPGLSEPLRRLVDRTLDPDARPPSPSPERPTLEDTRRRLRAMMQPSGPSRYLDRDGRPFDENAGKRHFERLRRAALAPLPVLFHTALADALGIDPGRAAAMTRSVSYHALLLSLRALGLDAGQAFLIVAAVFPQRFGEREAIRLFVERFTLMPRHEAIERLGYRRADDAAAAAGKPRRNGEAVPPPAAPGLKAS